MNIWQPLSLVLSLILVTSTAGCMHGCNCTISILKCAADSLVFNKTTIFVNYQVLPNLTTIPAESIQNMSLEFHSSILEVKRILITENPMLKRVMYNPRGNNTKTLTMLSQKLAIFSNPNLSTIDIRYWNMPEVTLIDLSNNSLEHIPSGTFRNKTAKLKSVYLRKNKLITLHYCSMFDSFNPFIDTSSKRINLWIHGNSITCDCHHIYLRNTNWFSIREYINCSGKSANLLNFNAEACQNPTYVKGCPNKCPTECDCLGHFTGEVCSEPTSCAAMHCSYYHNCISHPSTGKPTCVEDLLYSRVRYGNRKRESCSSSPDCQYHLKDSVCNTYSENCECPPNTVAHDNKCVPMWVPCKAEMQCILFTFTAQCDGRPLNDLGDAMYHNRMPLLSESDCLCYLYAKSENERESCTGYRLRESSKPSAYIAKNGLGILDQEYLLPLVLGVLSILGNMTLCMIRRTRRKAKAKRKEDHKRYKEEMRKEHLHDLASSLPVTIPNVEETNNSKASKISKRRDSFKSVISTKKRPKSLINKTQLEETN